MTAPGNSALLITLLAVFVACSAYAAGRLHQRYQMERDREEAYRDGYDTATRSVFSLAARVIAPRRAVRASVPVEAAQSLPATPAAPPAPPADGPGRAGLLRRSAVPGSAAAAGAAAVGEEPESLGFPVPPPPPPRVVAEPAAVGGVVYQQFPDPRTGDEQPAAEDASAAGRHTVPDELVQASTYRLPPDRIFRAKVPNSAALPEEPTTPLPAPSVPKPRQS